MAKDDQQSADNTPAQPDKAPGLSSLESQALDLPNWSDQVAPSPAGPPLNSADTSGQLGPLLKIPLEVRVVLGSTKRTLAELAHANPGSFLELDSLAGEPVLLTVAGTPFARAEVVVIDNQYAVRITELLQDLATMVDTARRRAGHGA